MNKYLVTGLNSIRLRKLYRMFFKDTLTKSKNVIFPLDKPALREYNHINRIERL